MAWSEDLTDDEEDSELQKLVLLVLDGAWNSEIVIDEGDLRWLGIEYPRWWHLSSLQKDFGASCFLSVLLDHTTL
jgi:hypothetical protein